MVSVAWPAIDLPAKRNIAARAHHAAQRAQGRGLAGAIRAEQRRDAALLDLEIEPEQHLDFAVEGAEAAGFDQRRHLRVVPR
jgi:hypothetical protein